MIFITANQDRPIPDRRRWKRRFAIFPTRVSKTQVAWLITIEKREFENNTTCGNVNTWKSDARLIGAHVAWRTSNYDYCKEVSV